MLITKIGFLNSRNLTEESPRRRAFFVKTAVFAETMYQKFFVPKRSTAEFDKIAMWAKKMLEHGEILQYSKFVKRNQSLLKSCC